jgi:hypothetical protein
MAMWAGPAFEALTTNSPEAPQKWKSGKQPVGERRTDAVQVLEAERDKHPAFCSSYRGQPYSLGVDQQRVAYRDSQGGDHGLSTLEDSTQFALLAE